MCKVIWKANYQPSFICDFSVRKYFLDKQTFRFLCSALPHSHSPQPCPLLDQSNSINTWIWCAGHRHSFPMMFVHSAFRLCLDFVHLPSPPPPMPGLNLIWMLPHQPSTGVLAFHSHRLQFIFHDNDSTGSYIFDVCRGWWIPCLLTLPFWSSSSTFILTSPAMHLRLKLQYYGQGNLKSPSYEPALGWLKLYVQQVTWSCSWTRIRSLKSRHAERFSLQFVWSLQIILEATIGHSDWIK